MINNLAQQKGFGFCSVYTFANIFREKRFLEFLSDKKYEACNHEKASEMFRLLNLEIRLHTTLYVSQSLGQLPRQLVWGHINKVLPTHNNIEKVVTAHILTVQIKEGDMWHCVGVVKCNGAVYYSDPYCMNFIKLESSQDLADQYIRCHHVETPYLIYNDEFALIRGEGSDYEKLFNQN